MRTPVPAAPSFGCAKNSDILLKGVLAMARQPEIQYIRYYSDGSAARQLAPAPHQKRRSVPQAARQPVKQTVIEIDPLATLALIVAIAMVIMMLVGWAKLSSARQQQERMTAYVEQLEQQNKELTEYFESGYSLEAVEQAALALGLVPEEQVRHVQIRVPQQEEAPVEQLSWWERIYTFLAGPSA